MRTSTRSTRRSSSVTIRRCGGARSPQVAASCWRRATRRSDSGCARRCRKSRPVGSARTSIVVPARFDAYSQASKDVFAIFDDTTPIVEGISIDEAFLDVAGLAAPLGDAGRDRSRTASSGTRRRRPADHRRRGADEIPREGRERCRQARRAPPRRSRPRTRVPPSTSGRQAVGRRRDHRSQARRPWRPHGRRGGRHGSGGTHCDRRHRHRAASSMRSRTTSTPAGSKPASDAARSVRSRHSAGDAGRPTRSR